VLDQRRKAEIPTLQAGATKEGRRDSETDPPDATGFEPVTWYVVSFD
jgi:hypothetical protein